MDSRVRNRALLWAALIAAILTVGSACAPAARPEVEQRMDNTAPPAAKEAAPAPTAAPAAGEASDGLRLSTTARYASVDRMIIKNAAMTLLVENTDVAVDRITGLIVEYGGYVVSSRSWYSGAYKEATVTIGVPVAEFENMLRRLRSLARQVMEESATGEDVTDQYVDLNARIKNLEATAARIRGFLDAAQNVEEALQVNAQLSQVEEEIEVLKGKANYLVDRAAYSTITIQLSEPRPSPTPRPTATPTHWNPGRTFKSASEVLTDILRGLGDAAIWTGVVCLPIALPVGLVLWFVARLIGNRRRRRKEAAPEPAHEE